MRFVFVVDQKNKKEFSMVFRLETDKGFSILMYESISLLLYCIFWVIFIFTQKLDISVAGCPNPVKDNIKICSYFQCIA